MLESIRLIKDLARIPLGERVFTRKEAKAKEKKEAKELLKSTPFVDRKNKTVTIPLRHVTADQRDYLKKIEKQNKPLVKKPKVNRPVLNGGKQGWFVIGNKEIFARSDWERKYAFYLENLKVIGHIKDWLHEPDTFWFKEIKRGVNNYKPDFKVFTRSGETEYHEVKGYFDSKSKTKIKRMAKYHPTVKLKVVDSIFFKNTWQLYSDRYKVYMQTTKQ